MRPLHLAFLSCATVWAACGGSSKSGSPTKSGSASDAGSSTGGSSASGGSKSASGGSLLPYGKGPAGQLWVDMTSGDLVVFDAADGTQVKKVAAPDRGTGGIMTAGGLIWVSEGRKPDQMVAIDPKSDAQLTTVDASAGGGVLPFAAAGKAWFVAPDSNGDSYVWAATATGTVKLATGNQVFMGGGAGTDAGAFFIAQESLLSGPLSVVQIDPGNTQQLGKVSIDGLEGVPSKFPIIAQMAAMPAQVFVLTTFTTKMRHALIAIDATNHTVKKHAELAIDNFADVADMPLVDGDKLYAADQFNGKVHEIDPDTFAIHRSLDFRGAHDSATSIAFPSRGPVLGGGAVWLAGLKAGKAFIRRMDLADGTLGDAPIPPELGSALPESIAFLPPK